MRKTCDMPFSQYMASDAMENPSGDDTGAAAFNGIRLSITREASRKIHVRSTNGKVSELI